MLATYTVHQQQITKVSITILSSAMKKNEKQKKQGTVMQNSKIPAVMAIIDMAVVVLVEDTL